MKKTFKSSGKILLSILVLMAFVIALPHEASAAAKTKKMWVMKNSTTNWSETYYDVGGWYRG